MTVTMPEIEISFQQRAASLAERSERGYAVLIVRDETDTTFTYKEYNDITEVDSSDFTADNYQAITDVFTFAPYKCCVVRIALAGTMADALTKVEANVKTGWVTIADGTTTDFTTLASWNKSKETLKKSYKTVCYKAATTDCKHIVNFYNDSVTFNDTRALQTGEQYTPSLIGMLAACNIKRAISNYTCSNLSRVTEVADNNAAVGAGKFILINDTDGVKVAAAVNSLQTTNGKTLTEDMKYIDIVEAMDLINDDIYETFKDYQSSYKNKLNNQMLFISAVNGYFTNLMDEDVLDEEYTNVAGINVEVQRASWVASGKAEAATWTDAKVKAMTYKRSVFLASDIKILGAMENLNLVNNMA